METPETPAAPDDAKPPADAKPRRVPQPKKRPVHWQRELGVTVAEHAGVLVTAGWEPHHECTKLQYVHARARFRGGDA